jgi:hypothetical protein
MVEQQPLAGIFREVRNEVDAIEERTAVCRPFLDRCGLIPVALSWAQTFSVHLPCHHHRLRRHLIMSYASLSSLSHTHLRLYSMRADSGIRKNLTR